MIVLCIMLIERRTVVKYGISDSDAKLADFGSEVKLLISSYDSKARVVRSVEVPSSDS